MAPSSKGDPYLSARPSMNLRSMSPETRKQLSAMVKRIVADSVRVHLPAVAPCQSTAKGPSEEVFGCLAPHPGCFRSSALVACHEQKI